MSLKTKLKQSVPPAWRFRLLELKKRLTLSSFKTNTYSGDGEDVLLLKLFKEKPEGFYVDVGCFHPKMISNTCLLHARGWRGVNIDPNGQVIKLFNQYRPKDTNLELGIAKKADTKTYYNFTHPGVNTFDQVHAEEKSNKNWNELISTSKIQCQPLAAVLQKYSEGKKIDILDVDVEGLDLEVLESNDWKLFRPSVVLVEDRMFREELTESAIYHFLQERGYVFHAYNNITLIMVAEEFLD